MTKLIPSIVIMSELPQWIVSSDRAAYHPATSTIYMTDRNLSVLLHELGHHALALLGFRFQREVHARYDALWRRVFG
jgi:hypothetical protein